MCHRDIKPDNILMSPETFQIKLIDLGLSHFTSKSEIDSHHLGTPLYMSPQALSCYTKSVKYNVYLSDVWSIGMVAVEILLG